MMGGWFCKFCDALNDGLRMWCSECHKSRTLSKGGE